jgi:hypothetical protein
MASEDALSTPKKAGKVQTESAQVQIMSVLFNGDATNGSANVRKDINIESTGTVTTVNDETNTLTTIVMNIKHLYC